MLMYFICKAVDMAPQPIRCLWSGDNKHLKKKIIIKIKIKKILMKSCTVFRTQICNVLDKGKIILSEL